jgi:aryl-alcohol dehydrogenase-like predicted oxidoreductase
VVDELTGIAGDFSLTAVQAALLWLLARPEVTNVLIGPKTEEQVDEAVAALDRTSPEDRVALRSAMDEVLAAHAPEPLCPFPDQLV